MKPSRSIIPSLHSATLLFVYSYLDDLLVAFLSEEEYKGYFRQLFTCLKVCISTEVWCAWNLLPQISDRQIWHLPITEQAQATFSTWNTVEDFHRFLGLVNFWHILLRACHQSTAECLHYWHITSILWGKILELLGFFFKKKLTSGHFHPALVTMSSL